MISAEIILKDNEHKEIVNTEIFFDADPSLSTPEFVKRAWALADSTALEMSGTDNYRLELIVTCDFTEIE
jgi:hypothetical protein